MTRENTFFKHIAITLCILMVISSLGTLVCVSEDGNRNTQFFAVNLYLEFSPKLPHSMKANTGIRVVSWMKKPEIFPDNPTLTPEAGLSVMAFSGKNGVGKPGNLQDIYTSFKSTSFFLII